MKTGIYALYWSEVDLVYIGASQDVEDRFNQHMRKFKKCTHYNKRMQEVFTEYGKPDFYVLEYCTLKELSASEISWVNEFNALDPDVGLNIAEPGLCGETPTKYSKLLLLSIFRELYLYNNTFKYISSKFSVPTSLPSHIFYGHNHLWLRDRYPKQYAKMLCIDRKNNSIQHRVRTDTTKLTAPNGSIHLCTSIKPFASAHGLIPSNLSQLILGNRKTHKGWKVYEEK